MNIHFENPDLLFLLWVVLLQAALLWIYWRWRSRTLKRLGSPALAQRLLLGFSAPRFWLKNLLFGLALVLLVIAIANPREKIKREPPDQKSADIVLALDISRSMLAQDVAPSRLEQAKTFTQNLIKKLEGERIGLVFFAGDAYPQMPLSTDYDALLMFVRNAGPEFIANQGTAMSSCIELAGRMFESNSAAGRGLVIISDGETHSENTQTQARDSHKEGLVVYTVAVGTTAGSTIPDKGRSPRRDGMGQVVRTSADPGNLREVAAAGGGSSFDAADAGAVSALAEELGRLQKVAVKAKAYTDYIPYFQWFLLPCLLLLVVEQILWWRGKEPAGA